MDQSRRYQVFVSSTYLDLQKERQAVISTLLECDAFPAGMELFPATDEDAWTLIERIIDECDYYVLVIGGKYGSVDPIDDLSYTEKEYNYAVAKHKPVMAFLHGNTADIPLGKSEVDVQKRDKLNAFRERVKAAKHVKYWTTADELGGQVARSFNRMVKIHPKVGWLRADQVPSTEALLELEKARKRIGELEGRLKAATIAPPMGVEDLAQGRDKYTLPLIVGGSYRRKGAKWTAFNEWVRIDLSWDSLFAVASPVLLDECEQGQFRSALQQQICQSKLTEIDAACIEKLDLEDPDNIEFSDLDLTIDDEDFGTILVQLKALGLIERGTRRRSVQDAGTYWIVTPYGETRTIQLRAIKRSSADMAIASLKAKLLGAAEG